LADVAKWADGTDIYKIAKNCRTGVGMIDKYCASHAKRNLDAVAINVRKSHRPAAKEAATKKSSPKGGCGKRSKVCDQKA
jgi:hypothetical protein